MSGQTVPVWPVMTIKGAPDPEVLGDLRALAGAAAEADGNPPLSEQTWVELRSPDPDDLLVLASYAAEEHSDPATASALAGAAVVLQPRGGGDGVLELVVHPAYRNQGVATGLLDELRRHVELPSLRAWSHGGHEGAARL